MSSTLVHYPPSPSSRSRDSYLSIENSRRESMISTSAASYETAYAGPPSVVSRTGSVAGDEPPSLSGSPQINLVNLLPKDNRDSAAPIHIPRVSQETVTVAHESPPPVPRAIGNSKVVPGAFGSSAHRVHSVVARPVVQRSYPDALDLPKQLVARPTVVEGPNGLTPPPSPPSTESFRLRSGAPILSGLTVEEPLPVDVVTPRPSTPTQSNGELNGTLSEYIVLI